MLGALTLVSGCSLATPSNEFQSYGPFAVRSTGSGELSTGIYSIVVDTSGVLEVGYLAPRSHCSSLRMHFLLDGVQKAVSDEVAPGHATGYVNLGPVEPGQHLVALQAEGIEGGCNVGYVSSWGGSATVWTSKFPAGAHPAVDAITAGCSGGILATYSGVRIHGDGTVEHYSQLPQPSRATQISYVPAEQAQALFTRARHLDFGAPQPPPIPDYRECDLGVWAGGIEHVLTMRDAPADVREVFDATMALARDPTTHAE
jgi:hypothetical protein